ncbi:TnsD family Tn7-like transposition protein [Pseudomonas sp. IT-P260]|uniref:TnsD family Tn7-like transposition protein n=1 Tax=Pseudomonas sp. IT-P260 TaxID=3026457 RepID=UPI0039DFBC12
MELFPQAFPDETIHSLAARYHRLAANTSYRQTSYELFGRYSRTCGSAFPCCLNALSQRLSNQMSVNQLIQAHTLLPLFAPFLSSRQMGAAIEAMSGPTGVGLKMSVGITASGFERFGSLRFCEHCVARDGRHTGQAYWHRIHQAAGVLVCPYHKAVLKVVSKPRDDWRYFYLPNSLEDHDLKDAVQNQDDILALTDVARLTAWGLCNPERVSKLVASGILRYRLAELGILHHKRLRLSQLLEYLNEAMEAAPRLKEYQLLNADGSGKCDWAVRLLRTPRGTYHPFRFYFLCYLLGLTTERFAELGISFAVSGPSICVDSEPVPHQQLSAPAALEVQAHRNRFLAYSKSTRVHDRAGYMWLYRNDRNWLSDYVRIHRAPSIRRPYVDWAARDAELVAELPKARDYLLQLNDPPVRISYAGLARCVSHHYDFLRLPGKLPRATEIARQLVETEHDFQLRKIAKVLLSLPQTGKVSLSKLMRLAAIRLQRVSNSEIYGLISNRFGDI